MSMRGALRFGHYAFPPNRLGYCGPADHQSLLEYVASESCDEGLLQLERRFDGAYPYLNLIALANGIADPFDERVVEAYWIGNAFLEKVTAAPFYESMQQRFSVGMKGTDFQWLSTKLEMGARPQHNFHVFEIYTRIGLMRDTRAAVALEAMDACRVSWGRVAAIEGSEVLVERPQLVLQNGEMSLSEPRAARVTRQRDGHGFVDAVRVGQHVSIHWDWACEILSRDALGRLQRATAASLRLANLTI